jgi:hypothetical protein
MFKKVLRKKTSSKLYGWLKDGKYYPYPDGYPKSEFNILSEMASIATKKYFKKGSLTPEFLNTLGLYRLLLLNVESFGKDIDIFDKMGVLAVSLANSKPVIKNVDDEILKNNRCNIILATQMAVLLCNNPSLLENTDGCTLAPVDFKEAYGTKKYDSIIKIKLAQTLLQDDLDSINYAVVLRSEYYKAIDEYDKNVVKTRVYQNE